VHKLSWGRRTYFILLLSREQHRGANLVRDQCHLAALDELHHLAALRESAHQAAYARESADREHRKRVGHCCGDWSGLAPEARGREAAVLVLAACMQLNRAGPNQIDRRPAIEPLPSQPQLQHATRDQLRDHTGQKRRYWLVLKEIIRAAPCYFLPVLAWY
jgi:hypothetical protein